MSTVSNLKFDVLMQSTHPILAAFVSIVCCFSFKSSMGRKLKFASRNLFLSLYTLQMTKLKPILIEAVAMQDYAYVQSLPEIEAPQASSRRRDLSQAFPEIAELRGDPFNSRYCTLSSEPPGILSDPLRNYLKGVLPRRLTYTKAEMDSRTMGYLHGLPPQTVSPFVDKLARFIIAFAGGAALVTPMLIMKLPHTHQTKSLITVSVAVMLFASLMSMGIRANNAETLLATATYSAVLVVFVGTSS